MSLYPGTRLRLWPSVSTSTVQISDCSNNQPFALLNYTPLQWKQQLPQQIVLAWCQLLGHKLLEIYILYSDMKIWARKQIPALGDEERKEPSFCRIWLPTCTLSSSTRSPGKREKDFFRMLSYRRKATACLLPCHLYIEDAVLPKFVPVLIFYTDI